MAYEDSVIEDSNPVTVIAIDSGRGVVPSSCRFVSATCMELMTLTPVTITYIKKGT